VSVDPVVEDILTVAVNEFAEHGFAGARVDAIAARMRTSKRMLYYHFGSKESLYAAALAHAYQRVRESHEQPDFGRMTPAQALRSYVGHAFDVHLGNPAFVRLVMGENLMGGRFVRGSDVAQQVNRQGLEQLRCILERGQHEGTMRGDVQALDVYANIVGLSFQFVSNRSTFSAIFEQDLDAEAVAAARRMAIIDTIERQVSACVNPIVSS